MSEAEDLKKRVFALAPAFDSPDRLWAMRDELWKTLQGLLQVVDRPVEPTTLRVDPAVSIDPAPFTVPDDDKE